ncbi:MAG TPA: hypothetical protein VMP01_05725 [Pirellulaceae bacterium]|nr:hypothetical protein [Pirellulaceae bacterium]
MIIRSQRATLDDLYRVEGQAELVGGRLVDPMASAYLPSDLAAAGDGTYARQFVFDRGRGAARSFV